MTSRFANRVDRSAVERALLDAVSIHSVNPGIDGGAGEAELVADTEARLRKIGLEPVRQRVADGGRDNVLARLEGRHGSPVVLFEAHLDTVGLSGEATTDARSEKGRVFGRGACDTKGSLVSMLEAIALLAAVDPSERPTIVFGGTIDEEFAGTGAETLVADPPFRLDMAVVGEPTGLEVAVAHKGVLRFEVTTRGVPAHSSKPHLGVNAISSMARVVRLLDEAYIPSLAERAHPLVGAPTLNVSTIRGGTAQNVVPAECVIWIDRRVNPGEDHGWILGEIDDLLGSLRGQGIDVEIGKPTLATAALDTPTDHPLVVAFAQARQEIIGTAGEPVGMTFGTDASFFGPAGIASVIFGPGSIDQAHSDEEWVDVEEVASAAEVLAGAMLALSGRAGQADQLSGTS